MTEKKSVLITRASAGIGKAVAEYLPQCSLAGMCRFS